MKILLYCVDTVGKSMAGPAIRYWEFAKALSAHYEVILSVPNIPDVTSDTFSILPRQGYFSLEHLIGVDLVITQHISNKLAIKAKKAGVRIILDAYTPSILENMEVFNGLPLHLQDHQNHLTYRHTIFSFQMADAIICASKRQRDLWMGALTALGRLTPRKYLQDPTLKTFLDIVPFGLSNVPPKHQGNGLREMFKLPPDAKVLLWGGGIWNWFDPLTLLHAVKELADQNFPVYLVFMGVKHPNEKVPAMKMATDTQQLAQDLGLLNKFVFFNYGWTPYEQRQSFLLEADIGVSTHFEHLETQYSFRTRILDYIWAQLPIICTQGDSFAELVEQHQLGVVVPYKDVGALSRAIRHVLENAEERKSMQKNLHNIGKDFYWTEVVKPILKMINFLEDKPKPKLDFQNMKTIFKNIWAFNKPSTTLLKLQQRKYNNSSFGKI